MRFGKLFGIVLAITGIGFVVIYGFDYFLGRNYALVFGPLYPLMLLSLALNGGLAAGMGIAVRQPRPNDKHT